MIDEHRIEDVTKLLTSAPDELVREARSIMRCILANGGSCKHGRCDDLLGKTLYVLVEADQPGMPVRIIFKTVDWSFQCALRLPSKLFFIPEVTDWLGNEKEMESKTFNSLPGFLDELNILNGKNSAFSQHSSNAAAFYTLRYGIIDGILLVNLENFERDITLAKMTFSEGLERVNGNLK